MSDVIAVIEKDHRTVEALFESYNSNQDSTVLTQLLDELAAHAAIEETLLYPALAQDGVAVEGAVEDHAQVKELIAQIKAALDTGEGDLPLMVNALEGAVSIHVDVEEKDMLPSLAGLEDAEAEDLLAKIEAMKKASA